MPRSSTDLKPPPTRRDDVRDIMHGVEVSDPYRWLENGKAPETRAWIAAQQSYAAAILNTPQRERLRHRIEQLMRHDSISIPAERNGYYFLGIRRANEERGTIYRRRGLHGEDEVLVDPHSLDQSGVTGAGVLAITPDGALMAYSIRRGGEDEFAIHVMEAETRREIDALPRARYYSCALTHDHRGFYYSTFTAEGPRLRFHRFGDALSNDQLIFGEGYGKEHLIGAAISHDGRYLFIIAMRGSGTRWAQLYFQQLDPPGPITPIVNDIDAFFTGWVTGDTFFMMTDWNAPRRRILRVDLRNPSRDAWREIVPERANATIHSFAMAGERLLVEYMEDVKFHVELFDENGAPDGSLDLPSLRSAAVIAGRWDRDEAFISYSSFADAAITYRCEIASRKRELWWRPELPVDLARFETRQVWYHSKDGTRVPMFLVHQKGLAPDLPRPVLLNGYGGFGISSMPVYSSLALTFIEAGGVYAVANLRGGGEFGEEWHRAGWRDKKQNVFDDFIAAAEWLIENGYTAADKLAISGGSNGGLLVMAALTQRPELFRAVVCVRPVIDMLRIHLHPLARLWTSEYGCAEKADEFRYLRAYSPYHNVREGTRYPAVLFTTGDADTRADPAHARKMTAMLQSATGSDRPVLIAYRTEVGHMPTIPVSMTADQMADEAAFLFDQLGMEPAAT